MPNQSIERRWQDRLALSHAEAESARHLLKTLSRNTPQTASDILRHRLMDYAASEPELAALLFAFFISQERDAAPLKPWILG
mgnify:CR=1 FL=1